MVWTSRPVRRLAGSIRAPGDKSCSHRALIFGGLASDEYPEADITVLADASGVYADNPPVNEAIGSLWGTFNNIPDWPELEGLERKDFWDPAMGAGLLRGRLFRERLEAHVRLRVTGAALDGPLVERHPARLIAERPERQIRRFVKRPVSYTHLTLPTNREV